MIIIIHLNQTLHYTFLKQMATGTTPPSSSFTGKTLSRSVTLSNFLNIITISTTYQAVFDLYFDWKQA